MKSWAKGVEDYLTHIAEIKSEFRDVLEASTTNKNGGAPMKPVAAAPTPSLFGTPAPAPVPASTPAAASVPPPLFGSFAAPRLRRRRRLRCRSRRLRITRSL